jgi:hypothetical protein
MYRETLFIIIRELLCARIDLASPVIYNLLETLVDFHFGFHKPREGDQING